VYLLCWCAPINRKHLGKIFASSVSPGLHAASTNFHARPLDPHTARKASEAIHFNLCRKLLLLGPRLPLERARKNNPRPASPFPNRHVKHLHAVANSPISFQLVVNAFFFFFCLGRERGPRAPIFVLLKRSDDAKQWSNPIKTWRGPAGRTFNQGGSTRDSQGVAVIKIASTFAHPPRESWSAPSPQNCPLAPHSREDASLNRSFALPPPENEGAHLRIPARKSSAELSKIRGLNAPMLFPSNLTKHALPCILLGCRAGLEAKIRWEQSARVLFFGLGEAALIYRMAASDDGGKKKDQCPGFELNSGPAPKDSHDFPPPFFANAVKATFPSARRLRPVRPQARPAFKSPATDRTHIE